MSSSNQIIEKALLKYNESTDRQPLSLILFAELNCLLMKIVRVLSTTNGQLVTIALNGSGVETLVKLSCFSINCQLKLQELVPGLAFEEQRQDLKKIMLIAG